MDDWLAAEEAANGAVRDRLAWIGEPFEGRVFDLLADALPPGALLWVGSSMPVRDLDAYFAGGDRAARILSNRGANGIDGVVSSALGASAVHAGPVVLVLGDLSFLHDLNGLVAARLHALSLTVVLVDNDGGGIFSFLPQARTDAPEVGLPERFEELFGTPHGMGPRLGPVVEAFGGRWIDLGDMGRPTTADDDATALRVALDAAIGAPGVTVVRYATSRARNVALHREVAVAVAEALDRIAGVPPPPGAVR
jgi:2-succinyl-5-enolpyruvyl-6-hydroxy-3-cyclohexene-1-carboxylate synthase